MKNKRGISYLTMLILVTLIVTVGIFILVLISKNMPDRVVEENFYINTENKGRKLDENEFIEYLVNDLEYYVSNNFITNKAGEVLQLSDYFTNKKIYIESLAGITKDKNIVKYIYEKNYKLYVVYDYNKVLEKMKLKIPYANSYYYMDSNGCKLYCMKDKNVIKQIPEQKQSRNAIIASYGYSPQLLLDAIMNQLDYSIGIGAVHSIMDEKVYSYDKYLYEKVDFYNFINSNLGNYKYITKVSFNEFGLEVKYDFNEILKYFGYESDQVVGLDENIVGTYLFI